MKDHRNMEYGARFAGRRTVRLFRALLILLPAVSCLTGCGPTWLIEPRAAERIAQDESKPLLLYFKAWDSSQHRNMVLEVFNNPAVKSELVDTVNVELEFAFFPEYCKRYNVQRPQVCVMCTPDGRRVDTPLYVNPVPAPEHFLTWLKRAKEEAKRSTASSSPAK